MRIFIILSFFFIFSSETELVNGQNETWIPVPLDNLLWWAFHRYYIVVGQTLQSELKAVFYGDSLTHQWNQDVWDQNWANYSAVNFGLSGDQVQNTLFRVTNGELDYLDPNMIVLMIGGNNLLAGNTVDEIVYGIFNLLGTIREYLPNVKILLLGIIPSNEGPIFWDKALAINSDLAFMADNRTIFFHQMWDEFLVGSPGYGFVHPDIYPDGYEIYADALRPTFELVWGA